MHESEMNNVERSRAWWGRGNKERDDILPMSVGEEGS